MSGVYFHIPFCKQACHYCNFHFSTSLKYKAELIEALKKELSLRIKELPKAPLKSIYFGGGTPSLLTPEEIGILINSVTNHFKVDEQAEITLEMNPDDYYEGYFEQIKAFGVNRLSVGVQSFIPEELSAMNRAHNEQQAMSVLEQVQHYFTNFSLDLIYGIPGSTMKSWEKNITTALSFRPSHISSYALTVEPKTVLAKQVNDKRVQLLPEEMTVQQFDFLVEFLTNKGYDHYELSSFSLPGYRSVNNTSYWQGKPYLGIGPSAHSYYQNQRSWNVSNNRLYIKKLRADELPLEREQLTKIDRYNEFVMTGLRTAEGVALHDIQQHFGDKFAQLFEDQVEKHLMVQHLYWDGDVVKVTKKAKFLVDGIASDLFLLNL